MPAPTRVKSLFWAFGVLTVMACLPFGCGAVRSATRGLPECSGLANWLRPDSGGLARGASGIPDAGPGWPDGRPPCYPAGPVDAFKPHLADLADYPYAKVDARIKLDQNESPEDLPPELKRLVLERLAALPWNRYPELHADDVRAALARHEDWPEAGVVLSPGSNLLILALAEAARQVLDTAPAFPYYKGAAVAAATPYRAVPLGPGFTLPPQALLAALDGPPGVLFLPVPHAPTGALFAAGDVAELAERARATGWLLVIDEAYHAFARHRRPARWRARTRASPSCAPSPRPGRWAASAPATCSARRAWRRW